MRFQTPCFLNLATLLPNPEKDRPLHDCSEILAEALEARKDLTDVPLSNSELVWFTDGSSYVKDGQRKAGATTVEEYSCEYGSMKFYALCGFGVVLSCGLTHTAVVPLD